MKLHLGAGSVFLDGWINIDLPSPRTFLAKDRPDLVEKLKTTDADYYGRHRDVTIDTLRDGPLDQECVVDAYGGFDNIPAAYWSVSEVLARHCFEHLSLTEARKALDQLDGVMQPNGILRIDVPDHEETFRLYKETGDSFYVRHLLGPRRNDYGFHMMSYTRERLRALVEDYGFVFVAEEPNIHFFPAFCLKFVKPGPRAPWEYVPISVPNGARVLDVGPGGYPHPRAGAYVDIENTDTLKAMRAQGQKTIISDIESGLPEIADGAFDFAWCSHVLEHLKDPAKAAATLSRIAKAGVIVMPSVYKDSLFAHEERSHLWACLQGPDPGGTPVMVRHDPSDALRDPTVQKIASRLYRSGPNRHEEARYLRKWFYEHEKDLDVVCYWEGELKVQVIE